MKATSVNADLSSHGSPGRGKRLAAITIGAVGGWFFFFHVQPWLLGAAPSPVLDRSGFVFLLLRTFPLVILPFVALVVALFKPHSKPQAFWLALVLSGALLIPVPLVDEWRVTPSIFGWSPFSSDMLSELAVLVLYMSVLALAASVVSAFLSPVLARLLFKATGRG